MAEIMYRQIKCGRSPFRPDRDHLHHICQRAGLSSCGEFDVRGLLGLLCDVFGTAPQKLAKKMSVFLEESNSLNFEANTVDGKALDNKVDSN